jgi:cellulose synthase (UDP-forming)
LFLRIYYLGSTINPLSIFFFLNELIILIYGFLNIVFISHGFFRPESLVSYPSIDDLGFHRPRVMIIIPIYKEELTVLEDTLRHVSNIEYPFHFSVMIADDGESETTESFIQRAYPQYLYRRRSTVRGHAKAGNINDKLVLSDLDDYDFLLILDCDMKPSPDILRVLVPRMYRMDETTIRLDPGCAFVQSKQSFDLYPYTDFLGQNYYYFYHVIMRAWDSYGHGVPCCGTNVLFSIPILRSIQGFQYGSVTEDFHTSLALHSSGYHSRYTGEYKSAVGLTPFNLNDFYMQRFRWSIGGLEIVSHPDFWERWSRCSWSHRIIYLSSGISPVLYVCLCILIVSPFLEVSSIPWLWYMLSFGVYGLSYVLLLCVLFYRIGFWYLLNHMQETIYMIPCQLWVDFMFLKTQIHKSLVYCFGTSWYITFTERTFQVTEKRVIQYRYKDVYWLSPFLLYMLYSVVCFIRYDLVHQIWIVIIMWEMCPPFFYLFSKMCH